MKEIGSEFWLENIENNNNLDYLNIGKDYKLLMSGRTAIDYIINDITDNKKIVYMPNYCCESMVQPFIDNGYSIRYYNVDAINNKYDIDIDYDCSIFFAMNYFGYNMSNMDKYIEIFNKKNIIVIEDITHRFLNKTNYCNYSNYLVCSLRKWFPILSGGLAVNINEKFKKSIDNYEINQEFVNDKKKAMTLKKQYMDNTIDNKNYFLELFSKSNNMFKNYKNMAIDNISLNILKNIDIKKIRNQRINNSKIIYKKLTNNSSIKLLYKLDSTDCPLFVPIIINNRDNIRKKLIDKNIYCPIHWPNFNNFNNKIYDCELSLICDQRYNNKEIEEYIDKIIEVVGD